MIVGSFCLFSHSLGCGGGSVSFCLHSFQIASSLTKELCALVFGINTFLGTILKSIIILIFADKRGLALDVRSQVTRMDLDTDKVVRADPFNRIRRGFSRFVWWHSNKNNKYMFCFFSQFLVYFIYFTLLTVMYFVGAAIVIFRHYRNRPREEAEPTGQPVELCPAGAASETEALSNGVRAWRKWREKPSEWRGSSGWTPVMWEDPLHWMERFAQSSSWSAWSCTSQPADVVMYNYIRHISTHWFSAFTRWIRTDRDQ